MKKSITIPVESGYIGCKKKWKELWSDFIFLEKSELFNDMIEKEKQNELFDKIKHAINNDVVFPGSRNIYPRSYVDFYESGGLSVISLILNAYCSCGENIVISRENSVLNPDDFFCFFKQNEGGRLYKESMYFKEYIKALIVNDKSNYPFYSDYSALQQSPNSIKITKEIYDLIEESIVFGVSDRVDGELILCNPFIRTLDGEWDTIYLDIGDVSFKSFRSFAECIIVIYIFPMLVFSDQLNLDEKYVKGINNSVDSFFSKIIDLSAF